MTVKSADKRPEKYVGPDGKPKMRMVPVDKNVTNEVSRSYDLEKAMTTEVKQPPKKEIMKVIGHTKNAVQGRAALRKKYGVSDKEADDIIHKAMTEVSKGMLGRYLKKVPASAADAGRKSAGTTGIGAADQKKNTKKGIGQFVNRHKGTGMAVDKMTGKAKVPATEDSDAVKAFLAKGGKIKKLPPAKAQGYHGKDDPGKDMHGVMDKPDTSKFKTRKKVKSMEGKTFRDLRTQLSESMLGHSDAAKLNSGKSKDSNFKSPESHIDHHHRQSGGHNKSGGDQDRHRYQVAKKLGYDV